MDERIELEKRGRGADEVHELNLDNCKSNGSIVGLTSEFANLEMLSMINVGLNTLKDFPKLDKLSKLEMSDNRLVGGLEHLETCPALTHINLSGNLFKDVDVLAPLKNLPNLVAIDLFSCPVTQEEGYRQKVFETIPHLKYLDGFDVNDEEAEESDVDGLDEDDGEDDEDGGSEDEDESQDFEPNGVGHADDDDDDLGDDDDADETQHSQDGENSVDAAANPRKRKHEGPDDDESSQD